MRRPTLTAIPGVLAAIIEEIGPDGRPVVRWGEGENAAAAATPVWSGAAIDWSLCSGRRVVVGFLEGDEAAPVILGLLDPPPPEALQPPASAAADQAAVTPRTLRIEGEEEVIIECGKAKIQLRADGTVTVLGERILSRSKGVNRIKGGAVQIN